MRNRETWPGGLVIAANKIAFGYSTGFGSTGVSRVGLDVQGNFRQLAQLLIGSTGPNQEMADFCGFCVSPGALVAWRTSHGEGESLAGQAVRPRRRQIAGFATAPIRRRDQARGRGGALPPFAAGLGPMTVADDRPGSTTFRIGTQGRLNEWLNGRSGQNRTAGAIGSGPGAVPATPKNGVGGGFSLLRTRQSRRRGSNGRADQALCGIAVHQRQASFVERSLAGYAGGWAGVNSR